MGGITFGLSLSLLIVFILVVWYLSSFFVNSKFGSLDGIERGLIIFVGVSVFILSIVLHEMAHFIAAKKLGIELKRFIFSITDGPLLADLHCASTQSMDATDRTFKVAIAGPLSSFAIASLFAISWWLESQDVTTEFFPQKNAILLIFYYAALGNLLYALVNLIPAFPCDGVLFLTSLLKRQRDGLRIIYASGIAMILSCIVGACYLLFSDKLLNGLWLILVVLVVMSDIESYLGKRSF